LPTTVIGDEAAMVECGGMMMPPVVSDSALRSCGGKVSGFASVVVVGAGDEAVKGVELRSRID
jgi:hypothetical protein